MHAICMCENICTHTHTHTHMNLEIFKFFLSINFIIYFRNVMKFEERNLKERKCTYPKAN